MGSIPPTTPTSTSVCTNDRTIRYTVEVKIDGFDWDAGNLFKNEAKHGLTKDVIENIFFGRLRVGPDPKHSSKEERFLALGRNESERFVIVAFTFRFREGKKLIRPISARYMHAKEVKKYEQAFAEDEK